MAKNSEKRTFFSFFSKKNGKTICITKKSCTFASQMSLGLWCNGNTADSGPAFPGSSPGSPTERFPHGNLFFYAITDKKAPRQSIACRGAVGCITSGVLETLFFYYFHKFLFWHIPGFYRVSAFHRDEEQGGDSPDVECVGNFGRFVHIYLVYI